METETPPLASAQVRCDHLGMPGVGHRNHPASVGHTMTQWTERDRELVNSSHYPQHSGQLHLLWAVHVQSVDGPTHKPARSSLGHSEGRLADICHQKHKLCATHCKGATVDIRTYSNMCRNTSANGTFTRHHIWTQTLSTAQDSGWCRWARRKHRKHVQQVYIRVHKMDKCTHEGDRVCPWHSASVSNY